MAECCDKELATEFCPHCGKRSHNHSLAGLLTHVRAHVMQLKKRKEQWNKALGRKSEDRQWKQHIDVKIEAILPLLEKWESWERELRSVVSKA